MRPDLCTVERVRVLAQEETPGLGERIAGDKFLDRFRGKRIPLEDVDAVTGATISSRALVDAVCRRVRAFRAAEGEAERAR